MNISNFLKKSIVQTFLSQVIILLCTVFSIKIISLTIDKESFGAFLVSRRFIGFMFPIITLNIGISLAYFLPNNKQNSVYIFKNTLILFGISSCIILLIINTMKDTITFLIFGSLDYIDIINPLILLLIVNSFIILLSGYFRGIQNYFKMNIVNTFFWVITFLCILFISNVDDIYFLKNYFYLVSTITSIFISLMLYNIFKNKSENNYNFNFHNFYQFGIKRLLTGFAIAGIFYFPIAISTHFNGLEKASIIGILLTILRLSQLVVNPFNIIFLPEFRFMINTFDENDIRDCVKILLNLLFIFISFGIALYFISEEIILLWFGVNYSEAIPYLIYFIPGIVSYQVYIFLRSPIDALFKETKSNYITISGLAVFFLSFSIGLFFNFETTLIIIYSLTIGLLVLGVYSIRLLLIEFNIQLIDKDIIKLAMTYSISSIIFYLFNNHFKLIEDTSGLFLIKLFLLFSFYLAIYYSIKNTKFDPYLLKRIISN